jgi:hypothetical protein
MWAGLTEKSMTFDLLIESASDISTDCCALYSAAMSLIIYEPLPLWYHKLTRFVMVPWLCKEQWYIELTLLILIHELPGIWRRRTIYSAHLRSNHQRWMIPKWSVVDLHITTMYRSESSISWRIVIYSNEYSTSELHEVWSLYFLGPRLPTSPPKAASIVKAFRHDIVHAHQDTQLKSLIVILFPRLSNERRVDMDSKHKL